MDFNIGSTALLALLFVAINGFFVASEFAIVKVRPTRLRELARAGSRRATLALSVIDRLDAYLSANQLGITLASLALGALEPSLAHSLRRPLELLGVHQPVASHAAAAALAFVGITFLHTVVGELAPKSLAIQRAEATTLFSVIPLRLFYIVMFPLIELLNGSARLLLRLLGLREAHGGEGAHSEHELRMIVASSHAHGVLDRSTRELLERVLAYRSRIVREVMTPRADVTVLNTRDPLDETLRLAQETGYTRYPLWDETQGRVLGFVHIRDLLTHYNAPSNDELDLRLLAREPLIVRETVAVDRIRRIMQRRRTHFAIVVDEANEFVGVVSLEDLIEEIVGDIEDEFDEAGIPRTVRVEDGVFEVDGGLLIEEVEKLLELTLPDRPDGVDTIAGYVLNVLGRLPDPGEVVDLDALRLDVLAVDRLRIRRLRVRRKALPAGETFRVDSRSERSKKDMPPQ